MPNNIKKLQLKNPPEYPQFGGVAWTALKHYPETEKVARQKAEELKREGWRVKVIEAEAGWFIYYR